MDYDANNFEMPDVGGDAASCTLQSRAQECLRAYNAAARRVDGEAAQEITQLEVSSSE